MTFNVLSGTLNPTQSQSRHPRAERNVSSVAACCVRPSYGARPTMHCQLDESAVFRFFIPGDLEL